FICTGLLIWFLHPREPRFRGEPFAYWVDVYGGAYPEVDQAKGMEVLSEIIQKGDKKFRARAVVALGKAPHNDHEVVRVLADALGDADPNVRLWATVALTHIGARDAVAIRALVLRLKDEDPRIRQLAAIALGRIGSGSHDAISGLIE